ncbi:MAG: hypothetical protein FJ278_22820, partial [Planctomycetes bacterium]|nr:hypothetical protein [Planctomycetota bacterium]
MKHPLRWLPILAAAFCALSFRGLQADKVTLEPPLVTVAPTARPPTIDGEVKTDEWKDAAAVTGFVGLTTGELVGQQTVAFITCDKANLYVGFKCLLPAGIKPVSAHGKRDDPLWDDDAVEVFLDVGHRHADYFQFIGNSLGTKWDSRGRDASWNAEWDYRATVWPGHWDAEFRIPFASLGTTAPADGGRWGLNLARDGRTPTREISSWAFMDGSFHAPERFGLLVFRSAGPVARLLGLSAARDGGLAMQAEGVDLALNVSISAGKDVVWQVSKALPRTADKPEPVLHKVSKPGTYKLRLAAAPAQSKEPIAMSEATLQVKPPVEVT